MDAADFFFFSQNSLPTLPGWDNTETQALKPLQA